MAQDVISSTKSSWILTPSTISEAMKYAELLSKTDLVGRDYRGKPGNILYAIQMGAEVGLPPIASLQNIAIINGNACLWGDALKAVCMKYEGCEWIKETFDEETMTATIVIKRKGYPEHAASFSRSDAINAGLWDRTPSWKKYPKRMLQMRARGFALRDIFPDVLKGLQCAEEQQDIIDLKIIEENGTTKHSSDLKIKDHEKFDDLISIIESNDLRDQLFNALKEKDYKELPIDKFDSCYGYVLKMLDDKKEAINASEDEG